MMMHPLFTTLATRPELLAEHAGAYMALACAEAGEVSQTLRARARLLATLVVSLSLGVGLGGVALLLWAVVPLQQMPLPWLLPLVPGVLLLLAGYCWLALRRPAGQGAFQALREQLAADAALLREAGHD
jgi:hypothetical protein